MQQDEAAGLHNGFLAAIAYRDASETGQPTPATTGHVLGVLAAAGEPGDPGPDSREHMLAHLESRASPALSTTTSIE
jgi:hypothetical protein